MPGVIIKVVPLFKGGDNMKKILIYTILTFIFILLSTVKVY